MRRRSDVAPDTAAVGTSVARIGGPLKDGPVVGVCSTQAQPRSPKTNTAARLAAMTRWRGWDRSITSGAGASSFRARTGGCAFVSTRQDSSSRGMATIRLEVGHFLIVP